MLRSLRARLTIIMIVLVLLPLIAVGVILTQRTLDVQRQQAEEAEAEHAARIAVELQAFVNMRENELRMLYTIYDVTAQTRSEMQTVLLQLMSYNRDFTELAYLDAAGQEIINVSRDRVVAADDLRNRTQAPEFVVPFSQKTTYFSPVRLDNTNGRPLMTIAIPVVDFRTNSVLYVLVGEFSFDKIWQLLAEQVRDTGHDAYVVDAADRVIAHRNPSVVLGGTEYSVPSQNGEHTGLSGEPVVLASVPVPFGEQVFNVVAEMETDIALKPVQDTITIITAAVIIAGVLTALLAAYLLTRMTRPLVALAHSARRLGAGDFTARAVPTGGSELSAVATSFNDMAGQLENIVNTLEERVAARTNDLQLASQLSGQVASILDPTQLLPQVVELTKSSFDLYHAHVYLLDNTRQILRLTAGAGEPGRIMRESGHRIPVQANSLVAQAARENTPVVVDDVMANPHFMPNPLLPHTRSEAAFPLAVRGNVVGVLDVQSDQPGRFDTDLQSVLQTMAGQVAVAISNAQLFAEVDRSSRHEQTLLAITTAIQSATNIDDVLQVATRELGKALRVSKTAIELKLDQAADQPGQSLEPVVADSESAS